MIRSQGDICFQQRFLGFTLVELLAVIVIVSLVATTTSIGLNSADKGAQLLRIASGIRDLDARARLITRTSGSRVVMDVDDTGRVVTLNSIDGETIKSLAFGDDCWVTLRRGGQRAAIVFDCQGHSQDYSVAIDAPRPGGGTRLWQVAGVTGLFYEQKGAR